MILCPLFAALLSGGTAMADSAPVGRTLVVALDGSGAYKEIQAAIDDAKPGDTIFIKAGHYREDVVVHSKDRLRLLGESRDQVTISGLKRVGAFRIGNEVRDNDYGVTIAGKSDVRVEGNVIANNLYDAVVVQAGAKGTVLRNRLVKNGGTIAVQNGAQVEQADNTVPSAP